MAPRVVLRTRRNEDREAERLATARDGNDHRASLSHPPLLDCFALRDAAWYHPDSHLSPQVGARATEGASQLLPITSCSKSGPGI